MNDAFLSYARSDRHDVERLFDVLENAGFDIWRDTADLSAGEIWRQALRDAIIQSDNLLFVISPSSIDSTHCMMELEYALEHNKRVIPVLYRDLRADQVLPESLESRERLALDWNDLDVAKIAEQLRDERGWKHSSSYYLQRAKVWEAQIGAGLSESEVVLSRGELEDAARWLEAGTRMEQGPLPLQVRFIEHSQAFHLAEAERWKALYAKTLARQLAAQAEVMIGQRGVLLETAALLAVESMRRSPTSLGDRVLRMALCLLPRQVCRIAWPGGEAPSEAVFSPDGQYIAALGKDGDVRVWRCAGGAEICRLGVGTCRKLQFQPGNNKLLTMNSSLEVWSLETGSSIARVSHRGLRDASYSGDGAFLATIGGDGFARIWDTDDYEELATYRNTSEMMKVAVAAEARELVTWSQDAAEIFRVPGEPSQRLDFSIGIASFKYDPTGKYLSQIAPTDFAVSLFDVRDRQQILFDERHWHAAFSGDGRFYAIASPEWDAHTFDLPTAWQAGHYLEYDPQSRTMVRKYVRRRVSCRRGASVRHDNSIQTVTLSQTGRYLATTSRDGTARVWEPMRGREVLRLLEDVVDSIRGVAFSADERFVSAWGKRGCRTWEATGHRQVAELRHGDAVSDVAFSRDSRFAATVCGRLRLCHVWSIPDGKEVRRITLDPSMRGAETVSINADGSTVIVGGRTVYEVASGSPSGSVAVPADARVAAIGEDCSVAVAVHDGRTLAIVALPSGNELSRRDPYGADVGAVAVCPKAGITAAAMIAKGLRVWNWHSGEEVPTAADAIQARSLSIGVGGSTLAMVDEGDGRIVHVLNLRQPDEATRRFPHEAEVTSVFLDPSETLLVTTSVDFFARVWSLESGEMVASLKHDSDALAARFSPDGRYVLSAGGRSDRTARLWYWRPDDLISEASARISRDLTRKEWEHYLGEEPYRRTRKLPRKRTSV